MTFEPDGEWMKGNFKIERNSLNYRLRVFFEKKYLFRIEDLARLTGADEQYIRVCISRMKNPKYVGSSEKVMDLIQDIGFKDKIKRWGLRGATKYADNITFDKVEVK